MHTKQCRLLVLASVQHESGFSLFSFFSSKKKNKYSLKLPQRRYGVWLMQITWYHVRHCEITTLRIFIRDIIILFSEPNFSLLFIKRSWEWKSTEKKTERKASMKNIFSSCGNVTSKRYCIFMVMWFNESPSPIFTLSISAGMKMSAIFPSHNAPKLGSRSARALEQMHLNISLLVKWIVLTCSCQFSEASGPGS